LGVERNFFGLGFSDIIANLLLDLADAIVNIVRGALNNHLDCAVSEVADRARQLMAIGRIENRKSKTNTLDIAEKNYMFGNLTHYDRYTNPRKLFLQAGNIEIN